MNSLASVICCVVLTFTLVHGKPPTETLSREDLEHFAHDPERHDVSFDHDAFLGSEAAKEYSKMTRPEGREKLREIFRKIDQDHDGKVNTTEMRKWIAFVAEESQHTATDKRWSEVNKANVQALPWTTYVESSYGSEADRVNEEEKETYRKIVNQDRRRWVAADLNKDDALTKDEFFDFLNPEEKAHMKDALIDDLLESVDTDNDGKVSEKEYLDDLARAYQTQLVPGEAEPDWVEREREQFQKYRDTDHDGVMNREEVGEWIMPTGYDPVEAETLHLFYHADADKDDLLSEEEILSKQDLFISSQATNYGIALEDRDEL